MPHESTTTLQPVVDLRYHESEKTERNLNLEQKILETPVPVRTRAKTKLYLSYNSSIPLLI